MQYLDLVAGAPAHFTMDAMAPHQPDRGAERAQQRANAVSERLVRQFLAADVVVIGAPFYNFSIPAAQAWIDRLASLAAPSTSPPAVPGPGQRKTVIIASSRGGVYSTSDTGRAMEHQESYLQTVLGFFGVTDNASCAPGRGHGCRCQGPGARGRRAGHCRACPAPEAANRERLARKSPEAPL